MKRAIGLLMVFAFVVSMTAPSFAALPEPIDKGFHAIKGGTVDLVSIPYDLAKGTYDETKAADVKPLGLFGGLMKSSAEGAKKAVTAAVHIGTFPLEMIKK